MTFLNENPDNPRQHTRIEHEGSPVLAPVAKPLVRRREAERQRQTDNETQDRQQDRVDAQVVHVVTYACDGSRVEADKEQRENQLGEYAAIEAEAEWHAAELPDVSWPLKVFIYFEFE